MSSNKKEPSIDGVQAKLSLISLHNISHCQFGLDMRENPELKEENKKHRQ